MKNCVRFAGELRKKWTFIVCDWLVNRIPSLLSIFTVMFCFVLFGVWYFPEFGWWTVVVDIVQIICMMTVTLAFTIGSREMRLKTKSSRNSKNRMKIYW